MFIDDAGGADAHADNRFVGERDELGQQLLHRGDGVITLLIGNVYLGAFDHGSVKVGYNADEGLRARQVGGPRCCDLGD